MPSSEKNFNKGLTLVEVLVAASIILAFLLVLFTVHNTYLKTVFSNGEIIKATELGEESLEVIRFFRDSSWNTNIAPLVVGADYFLVFNNGVWQATETYSLIDDLFERKVRLDTVSRDANGDIVSSGGTLDPDTLLVTSSVAWSNRGATTTKLVSTYIVNIFDN